MEMEMHIDLTVNQGNLERRLDLTTSEGQRRYMKCKKY